MSSQKTFFIIFFALARVVCHPWLTCQLLSGPHAHIAIFFVVMYSITYSTKYGDDPRRRVGCGGEAAQPPTAWFPMQRPTRSKRE